MEWLKNMGLKKSFVLLSAVGAAAALLLIGGVFYVCGRISAQYPNGGVVITSDGVVKKLPNLTEEQRFIVQAVEGVRFFLCVMIPVVCLSFAGMIFYRWKLKKPITVLQAGTTRIREHDLDFTIPEVSGDELGQVCAAFETMRGELLQTNQELWRQAEERKRLNAAFSHDLRNPLTVLKGTVKLLRQGAADEHVLERMETYVLRLEQYVEAMSSVQRLEQLPVKRTEVKLSLLRDEVEETVRLLAPGVNAEVAVNRAAQRMPEVSGSDVRTLSDRKARIIDGKSPGDGTGCTVESVLVDHGLFLTVAENLIGNAARYAKSRICVELAVCEGERLFSISSEHCSVLRQQSLTGMRRDRGDNSLEEGRKNGLFLIMTVKDDGQGYPPELVQEGPKPFGRMEEDAAHFGMGLYTSRMLCQKHGGALFLENGKSGGASSIAFFQI